MSKLTKDEFREFAELGQEVWEQGIEVSLRKGDARKLFLSILGANVATYIGIVIVKKVIKESKKGTFDGQGGNHRYREGSGEGSGENFTVEQTSG